MSKITGPDSVDFFAGLDGFTYSATAAGMRVLMALNHWPEACAIGKLNHPEVEHLCQDLQQFPMHLLPDLRDGALIASPACQGLSEAGQPARKGRGGSHSPDPQKLAAKHQADRNTVWAVLQAADSVAPEVVVVENVEKLLRWRVFPAFVGCLEAMGYHVRAHSFNSLEFGGCQDRQRAIITASKRGPIEIEPPSNLATGCIADVLDPDDHPEHRWQEIDRKPERTRELIRRSQRRIGARGFVNNVTDVEERTLDRPLPTITTQSGSQMTLFDGDRARILNPRELARAQGLPEDYILPKNRKLAGKMIGNAIDTRVGTYVCERVVEHMAAAA